MTGRSFVDTNVVVYAADENPADQAKHDIAIKLLGTEPESLVLSTQVLQEFYQAVTRKLAKPLETKRAAAAVRALTKMDVVGSDAAWSSRPSTRASQHRSRSGTRWSSRRRVRPSANGY